MKKIFIVIAAVIAVAGCSTLKPLPREVFTSFTDYRQYSKEGFLVSPSPYTYDFDGIGELYIVISPELKRVERKSQYSGGAMLPGFVYESVDYDEMVGMAVSEAKEKGADALVNFSINTEEFIQDGIVGKVYIIQGFCIKRK